MNDLLVQAVHDGTVTFAQAVGVIERDNRHPGGRPKGVKNSGPDVLDKAVLALNARLASVNLDAYLGVAATWLDAQRKADAPFVEEAERESLLALARQAKEILDGVAAKIDPAERAASQWRIGELLALGNVNLKSLEQAEKSIEGRMVAMALGGNVKAAKRLKTHLKTLQEKRARLQAIHPLPEEVQLVAKYRQEEQRTGRGRLHAAKGIKRSAGRVVGYKTEPEPIVERSLDVIPLALWGQDVTQAIAPPGLEHEPIPRRSGNGRRKLEPIALTEERTIARSRGRAVTWVCAGSGANGLALDNAGIIPEATIGEHFRAALAKDPVKEGLPYEPDGRMGVTYRSTPARFALYGRHIVALQEIDVDSLSLERAGRRLVAIDVACIRPEPEPDCLWPAPVQAATPKQLRVFCDRYRAPVPSRGVGLVKRPYGTKDDRVWQYRMLDSSGPLPRCEGEVTPHVEVSPGIFEAVYEMIALNHWKEAGCPLPILDPPGGVVEFLPRLMVTPKPQPTPKQSNWEREWEWLVRHYRLDLRLGAILPIVDPPCGYVPFLAQEGAL